MNHPTASVLRWAWLLKMHVREVLRWRAGESPRSGLPVRVHYGFEHIPSRQEAASGGIMKNQDLQELFPNAIKRPNLLYLISSALPPHVSALVFHARRAGVPIVLNQNGVAYAGWHGPGWERTNRSLAAVHAVADYIFYQSAFCLESARRFLGPAQARYEVLPNAVDTRRFCPAGGKERPPAPLLLLAGTHLHAYRVTAAIDALACARGQWPDARLMVAGQFRWRQNEAEALQEAKEYASYQGVGASIEWRGAYTQLQAPDLMRNADILIHAKYNDPCPRLVLEAMACGLPVIYSASGGVPELVGEHAGVGIAAPKDWEKTHSPSGEAIAAAIDPIMRSYPAFSRCARSRAVGYFDLSQWLERHRQVFTSLIGNRYGSTQFP